MLLELLLLLLGIVWSVWYYTNYRSTWRYLDKIPGPRTVPIFGNVLSLGFKPEVTLTVIRNWALEFSPDCYRLYAGPQPYVVISSPEYFEKVLSSTTLTYKDDVYALMRPWLGKGLLTANGQHWVKHRKMITPSFHFQILQDFFHIINETTDRFIILLEKDFTKEKFDFQEVVTKSTIDVICESAMGTRINSIIGAKSPMVAAMNDMCYVMYERICSAFKRSDFLFRFTPLYRLQQNALKVMHEELNKIINQRREFLQNNLDMNRPADDLKRPKMAFLDNLLTATIDGKPLTHQEIFEEVSTFMFEGHDTTASAITFAVYCLSRHPEIQAKAFQEQRQLFGSDPKSSPTHQQLQDMKYLELVLKEALRLYPSVPVIGRTVTELTQLGKHQIPKGTTILLSIISVAENERNFPQPFVFKPERFEVDERKEANPFSYVPFSAGPRNCIGQKFAWMELKVTVSKILRNFQILPAVDGLSTGIHDPRVPLDTKGVHPYEVNIASLLTLKSVNGVWVRLRKRVY